MFILGISAFYHDSAAALISDGEVIAAAQEERFTRLKHYAEFPIESIQFCLDQAGISVNDVNHFVFYEKPLIKFERLMETYLSFAPAGFPSFLRASDTWLTKKLFQKKIIAKQLRSLGAKKPVETKILFSEHHQSHAASAFFPSPFDEALILTVDGVGEWATTTLSLGKNNTIKNLQEIKFPHSVGLLYSAFTYYCGFKVNSGEYKLMGLAPYGQPLFATKITDNLIHVAPDGSFRMNMSYFDYCTGLKMVNKKFERLFGRAVRHAETDPIEQFHMDIAASIQLVLENIVTKIAINASEKYSVRNLCLAGGVALNCVATGKLWKTGHFDNIWVQPASGDAGGSLGAALAAHFEHFGSKRLLTDQMDGMKGAYLGPSFSDDEVEQSLIKVGAKYKKLTEKRIIKKTAEALAEGLAIGWMQGRMEFGPRSLGNRSIIADPRSPSMQQNLNLKVKFRESFRPFAPSVLAGDVTNWFEFDNISPYMLVVADVKKEHRITPTIEQNNLFGIEKLNIERSTVPSITHVDFSARLQSVHRETNPKFYDLISAFKDLTGCPMVVNTSFNVRGEPIVCTPEDAFNCFMGTNLDMLVIENFVITKAEQNPNLMKCYKDQFSLD